MDRILSRHTQEVGSNGGDDLNAGGHDIHGSGLGQSSSGSHH